MATTALTTVGSKNAEQVVLLDATGTQVTSFGGGTQYTEGDTDASITGTAFLWEDTADTLRAVSSAKPLPVNIVSGSSSGTEYTEDAAAAANPAGPMTMAVRADALAGVTSTDGDNIAARATDKGELYVKHSDSIAVTSATFATSAKQDTGNTSLSSIDGKITAVNTGAVVVSSSALPSGASTSAKQDTQITAEQAVQTSVELIDDAIKADDAAFTPATTKVMMAGFEFDDTTPDSVDEGDAGAARMSARREVYTQIRDAAGNERGANVNASNQLAIAGPVTNAGTFVVQENGSALTALQLIDDGVYTDDTSTHATGTSKGYGIMAVATPTDAAVDANDIGMVAMTTSRQMKVDASGVAVPVTDNAASLSVDWNGTQPVTGSGNATGALRVELANNGTGLLSTVSTVTTVTTLTGTTTLTPGTAAANLGKAEDAIHSSGDVGVMALGVGNVAQTALAADGDYIPQAVDTKGNTLVIGSVAHDGVDATAPVKVGARATNVEIAAVANNDRSDLVTTLTGKLITQPYSNPENFVSGAITTAMTGTTSTSLVAAPAAGLRNYLTTIIVSNAHATVGTDVIIQDGSGGTTLLTIPAAAVYGGAVITLPTPLRQPTTATAIFCANVTTGASTKVSAVGYKAA